MPIEKRPANPLPKDYVPEGGRPYKVKTGDSWVTVADSLQMDVWDLIVFNFQTRDPKEVNWYLRENVGCKWFTRDRSNWIFSTDAKPGIIYLPPETPPVPPPTTKPDPPAPGEVSGIWFGIGGKEGGHFFLIGKETAVVPMWSLESMADSFLLTIDGWRLGPGLGGSIGTVLVIITCMQHPAELKNQVEGGWDFNFALEEKWDSFLKVLKDARRLTVLGKIAKGIMTAAHYDKTRDLVRDIIRFAKIQTKGYEPQVTVLDIPAVGKGLEISLYYGYADLLVSNISLGSGYRRNP